jgi:hypothetical protein
MRAVPRTLTATTGVVLALALAIAGCGGGDDKSSPQQNAANAATATTPAATATTKAGSAGKGKAGAKTPTATSDALPSTSKSGASKSKSKTTTKAGSTNAKTQTQAKKKATTTKTPAVTPGSSGSDLTSGTGGGPIAEREDVVTVLRRYYQGFIGNDPSTICSLLTAEGQKILIGDGNGKDCEDSAKKLIAKASDENVALLRRTRDGLHPDDIKVTGNNATAQIGKTSALRLVQVNGRWLVRSPNVVETQS